MSKLQPVPTRETLPYWQGAARGELLYQHCRACGNAQFPPRFRCIRCHTDDLIWTRSAGRGVVYSFTIVHRAPTPAFRADLPYALVLVDMAEGFRLMLNLRRCPPERAAIGLPVQIVFESVGDIMLPQAEPLGDALDPV